MLRQAASFNLRHARVVQESVSFPAARERRHVPRPPVQLGVYAWPLYITSLSVAVIHAVGLIK